MVQLGFGPVDDDVVTECEPSESEESDRVVDEESCPDCDTVSPSTERDAPSVCVRGDHRIS
ncbi:hypothetical protein GCM10009039_14760 [Halocalculus aciditolerans]|uniref:Uncharacterized protein n=1 Tax=Halocalculus aciditolerans TaxID=1383812 RepID=A0A830FJ19_9EURY|nr:hypothetical protein GCM10009039_14760 [Halocalculus aciditolerans]